MPAARHPTSRRSPAVRRARWSRPRQRSPSTSPPGRRAHEQSEAAVDRSGRERHDDRLQPAVDDDQTVDEAAEQARSRRRARCRARSATASRCTTSEATEFDQRHQRADREVDAAEQNGQRLRHAEQDERQRLVRVLHEEVDGEALGMKRAVEDVEREEQGEREQRAGIPRDEVRRPFMSAVPAPRRGRRSAG